MNYMDELYGGIMVMAIVFLVGRMLVLMLLDILIIWLVWGEWRTTLFGSNFSTN